MKSLLLPIFVLLCFFATGQYNPSGPGGTPLNRPIALTGKSDGARTMLYDGVNFKYRAFVSVAEANSYILGTARLGWFPVIVNTGGTLLNGVITGGTNSAYWWKDGIADADLVLMNAGGSTNTSVGGGIKIAINGTNNIKSVVADLLTFIVIDSSTPNLIRYQIDTAGLVTYLRVHHPFILKVPSDSGLSITGPLSDTLRFNYLTSYLVSQDSIGGGNLYSKIHGNWVLVGSVGSGSGSTSVYNTISDMLAVRPANGTGAITLGNLAAGDLGGANYVYNSASTATDNGMTVLTPTVGSGAGRYLMSIANGEVRLKQLGVFPSADNTSQLNAVAVLAAGNFIVRPDVNSTYIINPVVGGFVPVSNLTIKGFGPTSILKSKAYASQNRYLINHLLVSGTDTLFNFTMTDVTIDGNTQYAYPIISGGSSVTDTLSELVHLELVRTFDIENCYFQNGGSYAGLYYSKAAYGVINNNKFDYIGSANLASDYDTASHDLTITNNKFHHFGSRDSWDLATGGAPNRRAGQDAASLGGYNIYFSNNEWWNDYRIICFSIESRHVGPASYLNNKAHGGNSFYGGYSVGGLDATHPLNGLILSGNTIDSVVLRPLASQDSVSGHLKYFAGTNYNEFTYLQNSTISNNIFPNSQMSLGFGNNNVNIFGNVFNCSGIVANYPTSGSGSQIFFAPALHTVVSPVDTVQNVNFFNNTYIGGVGGEFMRLNNDGALTKSLHIYNNPGISLNGGAMAEVYKPHGPTYHQDLQLNGNTISGSLGGGFLFYTIDSTVGGHSFSFQNNQVVNSTIDTTSNFVTAVSGAVVTVNKEGTAFASGTYSTHMDSVSVAGSSLVTWKNGQPKTSVALPGGGSVSLKTPTTNFKLAVPGTDTVKTLATIYGIIGDSATAKTVTLKFDSATVGLHIEQTKTGFGNSKLFKTDATNPFVAGDAFGGFPTLGGYGTQGSGTAYGYLSKATNKEATALGPQAQADCLACVAIGDGTHALSSGGTGNIIAIGDAVWATGTNNWLIGGGAGTAHNFITALGLSGGSTSYSLDIATADHQGFLGWYQHDLPAYSGGAGNVNDWFFGPVTASFPHNITLNVSGVIGTDFNAANFIFNGGKGTGIGTPGKLIFATSDKTSSGPTLQTLSNKFIIADSVTHPLLAGAGGIIGVTSTGAEYLASVPGAISGLTNNSILIATGSSTIGNSGLTEVSNKLSTTDTITNGHARMGNNKGFFAPVTIGTAYTSHLPYISMWDSLGASDAKIYDEYVNDDGKKHFRIVNDAATSAADWMTLDRSGISSLTYTLPFLASGVTSPTQSGTVHTLTIDANGLVGHTATSGSGITGSGTSGTYPIFNSSSSITDGSLTESGSLLTTTSNFKSPKIGIGVTNPGSQMLYSEWSDASAATTAWKFKNTNATAGVTGSGTYNFSFGNLEAGNGAVIMQFGANYGDLWSGNGGYLTVRNDVPLVFMTGATTTEKFKINNNGSLKAALYGSGTFTGTAAYGAAFDASGNLIEVAAGGGGAIPYSIYSADSTLSSNRSVSGNGKSLQFGTTGSKLTTFDVHASSVTTLTSDGGISLDAGATTGSSSLQLGNAGGQTGVHGNLRLWDVVTATDANIAITSANETSILILPVITANRTVQTTTPAASGSVMIIMNRNTSGNTWTQTGSGGSWKDASGSTITSLTNNTVYIFVHDGTNWIKTN